MAVATQQSAFSRFIDDLFELQVGQRPHVELKRPLLLLPAIHPENGGPAGIRTQNQGIHSAPMFPKGVDYLTILSFRAGRMRDALACYQEHLRFASQLPGSLCTFCRFTDSLAQDCRRPDRYDFPEFIPFISRLTTRTHHWTPVPPNPGFRLSSE